MRYLDKLITRVLFIVVTNMKRFLLEVVVDKVVYGIQRLYKLPRTFSQHLRQELCMNVQGRHYTYTVIVALTTISV